MTSAPRSEGFSQGSRASLPKGAAAAGQVSGAGNPSRGAVLPCVAALIGLSSRYRIHGESMSRASLVVAVGAVVFALAGAAGLVLFGGRQPTPAPVTAAPPLSPAAAPSERPAPSPAP